MAPLLEKGTDFIWRNARALERAVFEHRFGGGPADRIVRIIGSYQNEDGGFGYALEPDLRAPDSHPLFVEFGLKLLHDCGLRSPGIATRVCDFLQRHASLEDGIPAILPTARNHPRAPHWTVSTGETPSLDRMIGLVGLANWQGIEHRWLGPAVEACVQRMAVTRFTDAHTILTAFCLLERLPSGTSEALFEKLARELPTAICYNADAPVSGYGLTPLAFAPSPDSFCRRLFSEAQLEAHLDDLAAAQAEDGGWPISWDPPSEMARWEWRSILTVNALSTLRAWGRI